MALVNGSILHYTDMRKFLKKKKKKENLLRNRNSEFGIISQDCSLCDPFQKLFTKLWSVENHGRRWGVGEGFLHCVDFREILQNSFPLKPLVRLRNNFIEMLLGWPFSKLFVKFWSIHKHGISECGLLALYKHIEILVNSSLKAEKKKNGYGHLKNSGERSRAILALLFVFFFFYFYFLICRAPHSSVVAGSIPVLAYFFPRIDYTHCDRIRSALTAVHCFDNGYLRKQPVAWKEYCAEY